MTTDTIDATLKMPKYDLDEQVADSLYSPSLTHAIALGLTGTTEPTCQQCGAPAFVWCDGDMFCQSWWQTGQCASPSACVYCANGDTPDRGLHWFTSHSGRNTKSYPCTALPAAPTANTIVDTSDSFTSLGTPTVAGREDAALLQTPNLIERWRDAVRKARAAQSPIEQREWLEHAISLTELLISPTICSCGVAYNALTKRCEACDENERLMSALRETAGAMALDVDERCGF